MRTEDGNPRWRGSQDIQTMDYAAYAQIFGFEGINVTRPSQIGPALDRAFASQGITLLDVYCDKNVPPLPAHITSEFARHSAEALLKGDPDEAAVIGASARALLAEGVAKARHALHIGATPGQTPDEQER